MKTLYLTTKKQLETIKGIEDTKEAILKLENLAEDLEDRVDDLLCYNDTSLLKLEIEIEELQSILEKKLEFEEGEKATTHTSNTSGIEIVISDDGEKVLYRYIRLDLVSDIFEADIEYREVEYEDEYLEEGELYPCFETVNGTVFFLDEFMRVDF